MYVHVYIIIIQMYMYMYLTCVVYLVSKELSSCSCVSSQEPAAHGGRKSLAAESHPGVGSEAPLIIVREAEERSRRAGGEEREGGEGEEGGQRGRGRTKEESPWHTQ